MQLQIMDWANRWQHCHMTPVIVSALIFSSSLRDSNAFSSGMVEVACDSMTPSHGVGAQSTSPPYTVTGLQNPDGSINVKLDSTPAGDGIFEGFLLQARDSSGKRVGVFSNQPATAQLLNCDFPGGAVSHKGNPKQSSVDVLWQPQGYTGDVQFRATVVRSFATFWTGVTSQNYAIQPIGSVTPGTTQSTDGFPVSDSAPMFQPPIQTQPNPQPQPQPQPPGVLYQPPTQPQQPDGGYQPPSQPQQPDGGFQPPFQPQQPDGGYQPPSQPQQPDGGFQPPFQPQQPDGGYQPPFQPQQPDGGYQPPFQPQQPDGGYQQPGQPQPDGGNQPAVQPQPPGGLYQPPTQTQPPIVFPPNPSPGITQPPSGYLPPIG